MIPQNRKRLDVVDALRGFALLAIVLLHNLEHYNLYCFPENRPEWLLWLDKQMWDGIFFSMAGKAYATFSLLFGFSFFIQMKNERARGGDFRARFAWRMVILALFAQLHATFYNGDILLLYAFVGLLLISVANLKDKTVFIIALICILQPLELMRIGFALCDIDFFSYGNYFMVYADRAQPVMESGSFIEMLKSNISDGQLYSNLWQVENGRFFQTAALFMFGMLLGRRDFFVKSETSIKNWKIIMVVAAILFIPFHIIRENLLGLVADQSLSLPLNILIPTLTNTLFMSFLVALFTLLWFKKDGYKLQRFIIPYGRMSLTNYITQSIIGVTIYYGFGLGLYSKTGASATVAIGLLIFLVQIIFSSYWLSKHKQGPLEFLWKKATWIGHDKK